MDYEYNYTFPKLKKCVPRFITFTMFMILITTGSLVGFSIYTIPEGYVGYSEQIKGYIDPGIHLQLPWLPKPEQINIETNMITMNNYTTNLNVSQVLSIKLIRFLYDIKDIEEYVNNVAQNKIENYQFELKVRIDNDLEKMFNSMIVSEIRNITENDFLTHVLTTATDINLINVVFTVPRIYG